MQDDRKFLLNKLQIYSHRLVTWRYNEKMKLVLDGINHIARNEETNGVKE